MIITTATTTNNNKNKNNKNNKNKNKNNNSNNNNNKRNNNKRNMDDNNNKKRKPQESFVQGNILWHQNSSTKQAESEVIPGHFGQTFVLKISAFPVWCSFKSIPSPNFSPGSSAAKKPHLRMKVDIIHSINFSVGSMTPGVERMKQQTRLYY